MLSGFHFLVSIAVWDLLCHFVSSTPIVSRGTSIRTPSPRSGSGALLGQSFVGTESRFETEQEIDSRLPPPIIESIVDKLQPLLPHGEYCIVSVLSDTDCGILQVLSGDQSSLYFPLPPNCKRNLAIGHTLALLSDVVVLPDYNNQSNLDDTGLTAGWIQRRKMVGSGGILLVHVGEAIEAENIVLRHPNWLPNILEEFRICTKSKEWDSTACWKDLLAVGTRTHNILPDADLFPSMFEQTYRSFGGRCFFGLKHPLVIRAREDFSDIASKDPATMQTEQPVVSTFRPQSQPAPSPDSLSSMDQLVWVMMKDLETKQEDSMLDSGSMPLDFGLHAEAILEGLNAVADPKQCEAVLTKLKDLYSIHLEQLRDYFGRMFETLLDRASTQDAAALKEKITKSFRSAAEEAIPVSARAGGKYCSAVDLTYVTGLSGLSKDLEILDEYRRDLSLVDNLGSDELPESKRRQLPRWCKKLASRAIMLLINYIQGRLALHAIRQAALERERHLPKLPLF